MFALAAALGWVFSARWLYAEGYRAYAREQLKWPESRELAFQAGQLALRLEPGDADSEALIAVIRLLSRRPEGVLEGYERALRRAPADAFLWRDYAAALASLGSVDQRLEHAVERAQTLAPQSPQMHLSLAILGLKVLLQSSSHLQTLWLSNLGLAFRENPAAAVALVEATKHELLLCENFVAHAESNPWCMQKKTKYLQCNKPGQKIPSSPICADSSIPAGRPK